jgi:hypothetical protein
VRIEIGIVFPLKVTLNSRISEFENIISSVVSRLKDINYFFDHSSSSFKSWSITFLICNSARLEYLKEVSSAKSRQREIRFSAISLIYKINSRGPSTDSWGTPSETLQIRVITKLQNFEQSYKGKVKTHMSMNRPNQSTTGKLWKP